MEAANTMKLPRPKAPPTDMRSQTPPGSRGFLRDLSSLVLMCALFLIPIAVLAWHMVAQQRDSLDRAQTRLAAYEYGAALSRFVAALSVHRTVSAQLLAGEQAAADIAGRAAVDVGAAAAAIDTVNVEHGARLNIADRWAQARGRWARLQAQQKTLSASQSFDAHTDLIRTAEGLLGNVARNADAAADLAATEATMSQVRELVAVGVRIGAVQAQASVLWRSRQITAEQREQFGRSVVEARAALERAAAVLGPREAGQVAAAALDSAHRTLDQAEAGFASSPAPQFDATAWFVQGAQTVKALGNVVAEWTLRTRDRLSQHLAALQRQSLVTQIAAGASTGLALLVMILFGGRLVRSSRDRQALSAAVFEESRRAQAAIRRLMEEMAAIEKGDLRAQVTVTEDITGAIADSVNLTVGELRKVVTDINSASAQVTAATGQALDTARRLIAAATRQAQDIEAADVSVEMMTQSMGEVAQSAGESSKVARRSLVSTQRGSRAVQESIGGMNGIREQIQETSKRIKRLGESSQEIGQIVDVITDITEQTDVLALNAAIQAAAAGESGRAFAVVAEEVQLLAERSKDATTQIAALVKNIQSDTQEAVAAMERSIQGVVEGTRLSNAAGQSLKEIEQVTRDLTEMIQGIAVSTETQVVVAQEVRDIMRDVLGVTGSATEGTQRTSTSIAQVAELANALRASVVRFKVG